MVEDDQNIQGVTARIHLRFTGKGGGDFGLIIENGTTRVIEDIRGPPTSVVTMPAQLWLDLVQSAPT